MFAFDKPFLIFQKRKSARLIVLYYQVFERGRFGSAQRPEGGVLVGC